MDMTPLTRTVFAGATNLALASLVVAGIGLLLARVARRSAPLRHALAFGTICLLLLLPATPFAAALIDVNWLPQVSLIQWPTTTASVNAASNSTPTPDTGATAGSSRSATHRATRSKSATSADTGSASASSMRTLTADEIPADARLPGQSSPSRPVTARRQSSPPPPSSRSDLVAAGLAIVALWLLGTSLSLLLTVLSAARVSRLVGASSPVDSLDVRALLDQLASQLRLRRSPLLRSSPVIGVPFAWGPFRPVIVLPRLLVDAGDIAHLQPVLLHELAHVRRRDVWIGLLQRIVAAMYWWNPLVHRLNAKLAEAREEICDAHVLAGGCPPRAYAELLVDLAARISLPQPAAAPGLLTRSEPQLTRRVQHLLEDPPMSTSLRWFGKLALLAFIILGTTTAILVAAVIVNERSMSSVHLAVEPAFRMMPYVPNTPSKAKPNAVPATRPAAQTFIAADLSSSEIVDSAPPSPVVAPVLSPDPFLQPGQPVRRERGAPTRIFPDATAFAADGDFLDASGFGEPQPANPGPAVNFIPATPASGRSGEPGARPPFIGPGSIHGLAVIELVGNDDGSLKDVRWFTESLGNAGGGVAKLTDRLTTFATAQPTTAYRMEPRTVQDVSGQTHKTYAMVPIQTSAATPTFVPYEPVSPETRTTMQRVLAAQITASPQLRYEHVARVVSLCEPHVQRVIIGQSDLTPELTLTLGFVRDGAGKKISSSPVLIWNNAIVNVPHFSTGNGDNPLQQPSEPHDKIVEVHSLPVLLLGWRQTLSGDAQPKSLAARIRADDGVDPKLVEEIVQAILPAGFERVVLEPLGTPPAENVHAVVTGFTETDDGTVFTVSIGSKNGVAIGSIFTYRPGSGFRVVGEGRASSSGLTEEGSLDVIAVGPDQADCKAKSGSLAPEAGTPVILQSVKPETSPAVESADSDKLPIY